MRQRSLYIALIALLAGGCVKSFEFQSQEYERLLVVDGVLTDELLRHQITLAYTRPVDQDSLIPVTDAEVILESDQGLRFPYLESDPGVYLSEAEIAGEAGVTYTIRITTTENEEYVSRPSTLQAAPPVNDITVRYAEVPREVEDRNEQGFQFFLHANPGAQGGGDFFRFDWSETAQIKTPYASNWFYLDPCRPDFCAWFLRDEPVSLCYETENGVGLILGTTAFNERNQLSEVPIHFVSLETDKLRNRYSLEVTMYSIDEAAYQYFKRLKEINESGGSLFDIQQGAIIGNMLSLSRSDEPVLGYFEVSGVSRRREFFMPADYGPQFFDPGFRFSCRGDGIIISTTPDSIGYYLSLRPGYEIIDIFRIPPLATLGPPSCTNCSWYATTEKPDFWED